MVGGRAAPPTASGFLNVFKEPGYTSHDVVAVVRRLLGIRRVGHAGTLDPAAEGVLPICVGRATRLVDRLADADKGYYAEIVLGTRTRTDDAEGEVLDTSPIPRLDEADLERALAQFRGTLSQRPPAFSAVKVAGRRAYDLARRGDEVRLQPREVTVYRLTLDWWRPPRLAVTIACSKGTYIRAIARDLGDVLGCGAHLGRLIRLWVGPFKLEQAIPLDTLREATERGDIGAHLLPPDTILGDLPAVTVEARRSIDMAHGRAWPMAKENRDAVPPGALARVYDTEGRLLGLAVADGARGVWQPKLAFGGEPNATAESRNGD
jgi:tRNA pseudouridine55 synthase